MDANVSQLKVKTLTKTNVRKQPQDTTLSRIRKMVPCFIIAAKVDLMGMQDGTEQ